MANGKKLSVFGGGSSSGSVPVARSATYRPPPPRCACGASGIKAAGLRFVECAEVTVTLGTGAVERRFGFQWRCAACRQLPLPCPF